MTDFTRGDSHETMETETFTCPCCGQVMDTYEQGCDWMKGDGGYVATRFAIDGQCTNEDCDRYYFTIRLREAR